MAIMQTDNALKIYLEFGKKKVFACAVDWPGWCRSGRDEASAVQSLVSYAPRYQKIISPTGLVLTIPGTAAEINIIARMEGNVSTDFGVPDLPIPSDAAPLSAAEIQKSTEILKASWEAFDQATQLAQGRALRKGPRGGGRELSQIIDHVAMAEKAYLRRLGCGPLVIPTETPSQRSQIIRREVLEGIQVAAHGQLSAEGSRGGKHWPLAYFIRRVAWHVIDHTWEIEDRIM